MIYDVEKRQCKQFDIYGAEVRYKRKGLTGFISGFSDPCHVLKISKGSLAFYCYKKIRKGEKLLVQLIVPNETILNLNAIVLKQEAIRGCDDRLTGVKFMPFGEGYGWNSSESLNILRKLDHKYGCCF